MSARPGLWIVEGVPGSGKTTTAQLLCRRLCDLGRPTQWWLEEDRNHPVSPAALRRTAAAPGFGDRCLHAWLFFLARTNTDVVIEGSALQSTVRFMFANHIPQAQIEEYWRDWTALAAPHLHGALWLARTDMAAHYDQVFAQRGEAWAGKLLAYVEATPVANARGWRGRSGFDAFWAAYQDLCLALVDHAPRWHMEFDRAPARLPDLVASWRV